jgi:hypothetical protein
MRFFNTRPFCLHASSRIALASLVAVLGLVAVPTSAFAQETPSPSPEPEVTPPGEQPAATGAAEYVRHGFTMELGLGLSHTAVWSDVSAREHSDLGLAPLSLGLGGFLSPRVALIGRASGTSTFRDDAQGKSYQTLNAFYGPTLQYWATDRLYVGGGVGLAVLAADPLKSGSNKDVQFIETGLGFTARLGWAFALPGDHNALTLGVEAFASRFADSTTMATATTLGWQFF